MKCVNIVTLLGHVTNEPEVKKTPAGQTVCTFGLATNREWRDAKGEKQSMAEFHNLVAWSKIGEFCGQYVKKGKPLYVTGHLKTRSWENPQKVKLHRTEVIVDDFILLGPKDKSPEVAATQAEEAVS